MTEDLLPKIQGKILLVKKVDVFEYNTEFLKELRDLYDVEESNRRKEQVRLDREKPIE